MTVEDQRQMFITLVPSFPTFQICNPIIHTPSILKVSLLVPKKYLDFHKSVEGGEEKVSSPPEMEFNTHTPFPLWINWQDLLHSFRNIPAFVDLLRRPLEHAKFQKGSDARFFWTWNGVKRFLCSKSGQNLNYNILICKQVKRAYFRIHFGVVEYILMSFNTCWKVEYILMKLNTFDVITFRYN